MTRSLYVLGAPGVGKSTLVKMWREVNGWVTLSDPRTLLGALKGHTMVSPDGDPSGVYLGRQRDLYPGTDALSMAVAPHARAWAEGLGASDVEMVVGEGARLGNVGFLRALAENSELTLVLLMASETALTARREGRGSTQSPSWMRGAATGALNAYTAAEGLATEAHVIDTSEIGPRKILARLVS